VARLLEKYYKEIRPALKEKLGRSNTLAIPQLDKVVINMGVGKAIENKRRLECAVRDLALITGQRPVIIKAKKSVAGFKLREGQEIGCKVTLRRRQMYEFIDRLINIVIPRVRDFRGLNTESFDKFGNYAMGIADQSVFPEILLDTIEFPQGMDIVFTIKRTQSKVDSLELLKMFGMPFKK